MRRIISFVCFMFLVVLSGSVSAATSISDCTEILSPGVYVLSQSVSSSTTCIRIESSDVIFDGAGYSITGPGTTLSSYPGVIAVGYPTPISNVTVKNVNVTGWSEGIEYLHVDNGGIIDNTASSNAWFGIELGDSNNNTITNNIANSNSDGIFIAYSSYNTVVNNIASNNYRGIYLGTSRGNTVYNNLFNNTNNAYVDDTNSWNTTKQAGINIVGGPYLGGNFWAYPNGTGFSETCTDADSDGVCDSSYTLTSENVDYLPLSLNLVVDTHSPMQRRQHRYFGNMDNMGGNVNVGNYDNDGNVDNVDGNVDTGGGQGGGNPLSRLWQWLRGSGRGR